MQAWEQVRELRKAGKAEEALRVGNELRAQTPEDIRIRQQVEWVYYDLAKRVVERTKAWLEDHSGAKPKHSDLEELRNWLHGYATLNPERPSMVTSFLLLQLQKIGQYFDAYVPFLMWISLNPFRSEDLVCEQSGDKEYPPRALGVAREAAAWIKTRPNATPDQIAYVIALAQMVQSAMTDADGIWLDWDLVNLLKRAGHRGAAADVLGRVLKKKRGEFWVWKEAADLCRDDQPELALACYCHALRLGAEPQFVGKTHASLGLFLKEEGNTAQAISEAEIAAAIYDREGWHCPSGLAELLRIDKSTLMEPAETPAAFYAQYADEALALCFDDVQEIHGTYVGMTVAREGRKPRLRFSLRQDDRMITLLGRRGRKQYAMGEPVSLLIGRDGERREIVSIETRPDGSEWDCLDVRDGVAVWVRPSDGSIKVYISYEEEFFIGSEFWASTAPPSAGDGVRVWGATNPTNDRFEIFRADAAMLPQHNDIYPFYGPLRRHPKGFGFVEDVMVPETLLAGVGQEITEISGVAVASLDKKKGAKGWRAICLDDALGVSRIDALAEETRCAHN